MELMAESFRDAFAGYTLRVTESHQSSKKDTSGTAKAILASFNSLGCKFDVSQVRSGVHRNGIFQGEAGGIRCG